MVFIMRSMHVKYRWKKEKCRKGTYSEKSEGRRRTREKMILYNLRKKREWKRRN